MIKNLERPLPHLTSQTPSQKMAGIWRLFRVSTTAPHGGFAIGLERLTAQILGVPNVRNATSYPRDRYRLTP